MSERPAPDHPYVFTLAGRCGRCQRLEDEHLRFNPDGTFSCQVDHDSVRTTLQSGPEGTQWSYCPICGVFIEPKMAVGGPSGPSWGPGRGAIAPRQMSRLLFVAWRNAGRA